MADADDNAPFGTSQLEELRQGPNFLDADRSGPMLDSDFPPLPVEAATVDKSQCYVLGWLREEVATRMMKVANLAVKPRGDPAYYQTTVYALRYMWRRSEYFHAWTSYGFMDSGEGAGTAGLVDESRRQREDFAGWPLIAISCTVEEARQRRPSKAQFEWFKHVMGKEPRWFLIDSSYYSLARDGLWDAAPCCLKVRGFHWSPSSGVKE